MDAPEATISVQGTELRMLGTIPGFAPDGERVEQAIAEFSPAAIALGVPDSDVESMEALLADPTLADGLEPDELDLHLLELIANWGATQFIPSPDLHAAHAAGIPVHGIDMTDEDHTRVFTETVKVRHLVRRSAVRKRLMHTKREDANDPYHLVAQWDAELCSVKPLAELEKLREQTMADSIQKLVGTLPRLLVIIHSARLDGVRKLLEN